MNEFIEQEKRFLCDDVFDVEKWVNAVSGSTVYKLYMAILQLVL